MNDPIRRPGEPQPQDPPRRRASPIVWILLLLVLIAIGWYALTPRGGTDASDIPPTPVIDDPAAPPVEREPATGATPRA